MATVDFIESMKSKRAITYGEFMELFRVEAKTYIELFQLTYLQYLSKTGAISLGPFRGFRRFGPETWHEAIWRAWHPEMERQVTFGTGPSGRFLYGSTSFTVDFFDRTSGVAYEIDGPNHREAKQKEVDVRKEARLKSLGLRLWRIPTSEIDERIIDSLGNALLILGDHRRKGLDLIIWEKTKPILLPVLDLYFRCEPGVIGEPIRDVWRAVNDPRDLITEYTKGKFSKRGDLA